jgi:hypothetical protein
LTRSGCLEPRRPVKAYSRRENGHPAFIMMPLEGVQKFFPPVFVEHDLHFVRRRRARVRVKQVFALHAFSDPGAKRF